MKSTAKPATRKPAAADAPQDPPAAAAAAIAGLLPSVAGVTAAPAAEPVTGIDSAVVTSFVGEISADLAVSLVGQDALAAASGTDSPLVSIADVLRPALEAAAAELGTGVLGEVRAGESTGIFSDPESSVFALLSGEDTVGWFAVRLREHGVLAGSTPLSADAMAAKLGRISNVEMALTVEIGRTRMSVRDVLGLEPGAVIELDRSAGAPADVLLNGRLIAHGEIVVVDQDYAVRITRILDVADGLV